MQITPYILAFCNINYILCKLKSQEVEKAFRRIQMLILLGGVFFCITGCSTRPDKAEDEKTSVLVRKPTDPAQTVKLVLDSHSQIFKLNIPHSEKIGAINEAKQKFAPNFPKRGETPEENIQKAILNWAESYPGEYAKYIQQLKNIISQNQ